MYCKFWTLSVFYEASRIEPLWNALMTCYILITALQKGSIIHASKNKLNLLYSFGFYSLYTTRLRPISVKTILCPFKQTCKQKNTFCDARVNGVSWMSKCSDTHTHTPFLTLTIISDSQEGDNAVFTPPQKPLLRIHVFSNFTELFQTIVCCRRLRETSIAQELNPPVLI